MQQYEPKVAIIQESRHEKYTQPNELTPSEAQTLTKHDEKL
jgi:hypothetical protein